MLLGPSHGHLSICTWFLPFSSLKFQVWWTGFFSSSNWIFAGYTGSKNPVQTRKKNPVHQTWNFKLENFKNEMQIDRRIGERTHIALIYHAFTVHYMRVFMYVTHKGSFTSTTYLQWCRNRGEGGRGAIFCRSVNPIQTRKGGEDSNVLRAGRL